jgi:hypothetical protein
MQAFSLASQPSLLSSQFAPNSSSVKLASRSGIPTKAKFQVSLFYRMGWVGGWGEIDIKAELSPAEAGAWAELGKSPPNIKKL